MLGGVLQDGARRRDAAQLRAAKGHSIAVVLYGLSQLRLGVRLEDLIQPFHVGKPVGRVSRIRVVKDEGVKEVNFRPEFPSEVQDVRERVTGAIRKIGREEYLIELEHAAPHLGNHSETRIPEGGERLRSLVPPPRNCTCPTGHRASRAPTSEALLG